MKKITVKHYINNRLKSKPLYVRVIYDRRDTTFPSEIVSNVSPTEMQITEDKKLKREMEYETQIITSIIQFFVELKKEKFSFPRINFSALIHEWKRTVNGRYSHFYIDNKDIRDSIRVPLIKFLSEHTKIKIETVDQIVAFHLEELDVLLDLVENYNIYTTDVKNTIIFWKLLQNYEDKFYGDPTERWIYGADNMFGYYEWSNKNGKEQFEKYVLEQDILPKEFVKMRIVDFDEKLKENIENSIFFSNFTDTERNRR